MSLEFVIYKITRDFEEESNLRICSGMLKCIKFLNANKTLNKTELVGYMETLKNELTDSYQVIGVNRCINMLSQVA